MGFAASRMKKQNKSGFIGVSFNKATGKWISQFKGKNLGRYSTAEDAARIRDAAARAMYGHTAILNYPMDGKD
jgi:hypothetical protein